MKGRNIYFKITVSRCGWVVNVKLIPKKNVLFLFLLINTVSNVSDVWI